LQERYEEDGKDAAALEAAKLFASLKRTPTENVRGYMAPRGLRCELRSYQKRAVAWAMRRERPLSNIKTDYVDLQGMPVVEDESEAETAPIHDLSLHPLWHAVAATPTSNLYYNPYTGGFSKLAFPPPIDDVRGGILADEMGLGKTVEVIALILNDPGYRETETETKPKKEEAGMEQSHDEMRCDCGDNNIDTEEPLICCDRCGFWEHQQCVGWNSVEDAELGYICRKCEPKVEITATLVVCPPAIAEQWVSEVQKHTEAGAVRVLRYDGATASRGVSRARLSQYDLVVSTYDALRKDLHKLEAPKRRHASRGGHGTGLYDSPFDEFFQIAVVGKKRKRPTPHRPQVISPLSMVKWRRICLDEAQQVESTATAAAKMALELEARYRWCVTGTPLQSGLNDIYGLLLFLGVTPWSNKTWWDRAVDIPWQVGHPNAKKLVSIALKEVLWRTAKVDVEAELGIPKQTSSEHLLELDPIERVFYNNQLEKLKDVAAGFLQKRGGGSGDNKAVVQDKKILAPFLRLRQACSHFQVGSNAHAALKKTTMTLEELHVSLISQEKEKIEEKQRLMVLFVHAAAGILLLPSAAHTNVRIGDKVDFILGHEKNSSGVEGIYRRLGVLDEMDTVVRLPCEKDRRDQARQLYQEVLERGKQGAMVASREKATDADKKISLWSASLQARLNGAAKEERPSSSLLSDEDEHKKKRALALKAVKDTLMATLKRCVWQPRSEYRDSCLASLKDALKMPELKSVSKNSEEEKMQLKWSQRLMVDCLQIIQGTRLHGTIETAMPNSLDVGAEYCPRVDDLQLLHALHNLRVTLSRNPGDSSVPETPKALVVPEGDSTDEDAAFKEDELKTLFLQTHISIQDDAEKALRVIQEELRSQDPEEQELEDGWWQPALSAILETGRERDFLNQIKDALLEGSTVKHQQVNESNWDSILWKCNSIESVRLILGKHLRDEHESRLMALKAVEHLPRKPTLEQVIMVASCSRCMQDAVQWRGTKIASCQHCHAQDIIATYDHKLFQARQKWERKAELIGPHEELQLEGEALSLIKADSEVRGRAQSEVERVLLILQRVLASVKPGSQLVGHAVRSSERLQKRKQELGALYVLHRVLKDHILARDELDMCVERVQLATEEQVDAHGPRKSSESDYQYASRIKRQIPVTMRDFILYHWECGAKLAEGEMKRMEAQAEMGSHMKQLKFLLELQRGKKKATALAGQAERAKEARSVVEALPAGEDKAQKLAALAKTERAAKEAAEKCPVCLEVLETDLVMTNCHHMFHHTCIEKLTRLNPQSKRLQCPTCREDNRLSDIIHIGATVRGGHSTKITKLLSLLTPIARGGSKSLVFSQWSEMLEILARALQAQDITYHRLGGGGPLALGRAVEDFKKDPDCMVLLLPVKSGANGLNLCEATHVFLLEPLLDTGLELQAINRVHRIGQTKQTEVHRLVCKGTVEEKIHQLARSRRDAGSGLKTKGDKEKFTLADLQQLVGGHIGGGSEGRTCGEVHA